MSLRNSCLLLSAWLSPVALVAQQAPIKDGVPFTNLAYHGRGGDALGLETNTLKGGGPYWILLQYAKGPVVKPIFVKAIDSHAKILYMLPKKCRGFEEVQGLAEAVPKNQSGCNKFYDRMREGQSTGGLSRLAMTRDVAEASGSQEEWNQ